MRRFRSILMVACSCASLIACAPTEEAAEKPARLVETVTVKAEPWSESITSTGEINARVQSELSFRISGRITASYLLLHRLGHAHSIEVFEGDTLAGGIYGVAIGRMFFGESMFSGRSGGSKVALAALARRLCASRAAAVAAGVVQEGRVVEPQQLALALGQAFTRSGATCREAAVAVPASALLSTAVVKRRTSRPRAARPQAPRRPSAPRGPSSCPRPARGPSPWFRPRT